jgi:hypothetical protein
MESESRTMKARRDGKTLVAPLFACSFSPAYKNKGAFKEEDRRNRRNEQQVEIRRQKRDENISKRRNFLPSAGPDSDEEVGGGAWDPPVLLSIVLVDCILCLCLS